MLSSFCLTHKPLVVHACVARVPRVEIRLTGSKSPVLQIAGTALAPSKPPPDPLLTASRPPPGPETPSLTRRRVPNVSQQSQLRIAKSKVEDSLADLKEKGDDANRLGHMCGETIHGGSIMMHIDAERE